MQTQNRINIGQIGFGYWGSKLYKHFSDHPGFVQCGIAVAHPDIKRGIPLSGRIAGSAQEIIDDREIEAVVIATPPCTHKDLACAALKAGKDVFVEKILATNGQDAEFIKATAKEAGKHILVDYTFTFSPSLLLMRDLAAKGRIGKIRSANLSMLQFGRFGRGDVYLLLGSHMLSILGMFHTLNGLNYSRWDTFTREETESGFLHFSDDMGFAGSIAVSLNNPIKERKVLLVGESGSMLYDPFNLKTLRIFDQNMIESSHAFDESQGLSFAVDAFFKLLTGQGISNIDDAVAVNNVIDKIFSMSIGSKRCL